MKTVPPLKCASISSASILVNKREHVGPMPSARLLARMSSAHVLKDLLVCQPLSKAVSEFPPSAPMEDVPLTTSVRMACVIMAARSMETVPVENAAWKDSASRFVGMTETVCKEKSVLTASASQDVTRRRTAGLERFVTAENVCVTRDSSAHQQDVRTSMNVRMQFVIPLPGVGMYQDPSSVCAQLV